MIEEQAVRRLGSTRNEPVDAWVLTATSEDLLEATRAWREALRVRRYGERGKELATAFGVPLAE